VRTCIHEQPHMPRRSERAQVLKDIDAAIEIAACSYLFDDVEEEEEEEEHIQDLCAVQEVIAAHQYLSRDTNADRYDIEFVTLAQRIFGRL